MAETKERAGRNRTITLTKEECDFIVCTEVT